MQKYAKIENPETRIVSVGTGTNSAFYASIGMTLMDVEQSDIDGQWYQAGYAPMKSEEQKQKESIEAAYKNFDSRVEARLDAFAATRRYNSIYTAKAAKDSHIAKYAAEGAYCELMWGETYNKCDQLLAEYMPDVLAGTRPIPTWEEIEAQLPSLVWPDEQVEEVEEEPVTEVPTGSTGYSVS